MDRVPDAKVVTESQLPRGPIYRPAINQLLAARMTYLSIEAVGKFRKASPRATAAFHEFLVRKLGGSALEARFSAALLKDGAVAAGSAVLQPFGRAGVEVSLAFALRAKVNSLIACPPSLRWRRF
jgi:hypothetical protein